MALADRDAPMEEAAAPPGGRFRGMRNVVAPLVVLALLLVITIFLFFQFLGERPLNLRPHSNRVALDLQQLLTENNVPPENIAAGVPQPRETDAGTWNYHRFEVTVPATVSLPGLQEVIRRHVLQRYEGGVQASEVSPGRLQLAFGDWIFADINLSAAAPPPRQDLTAATDRLADDVARALVDAGIPEERTAWEPRLPREDDEAHWHTARVRVALDPDVEIENITRQIEEQMDGRQVTVRIETAEQGDTLIRLAFAGKDAVDIVVTRTDDAVLVAELPPLDALPKESEEYRNGDAPELLPEAIGEVDEPQVAIILDDGGYGGPAMEAALALTPDLTFAILPDTPFASELAERAGELGFEIMLHMPMASTREEAVPFPGELTADMDAETIQRLTREALAQIPGAVGVNNHTGSEFTTHADGMRPFLEVVQEEGLYFVDSYTTPTSVGLDLATEMEIPAVRRDVFLDNDPAPEAIAMQMDTLIERAKTVGFAVGIAHFRESTLAVLGELLDSVRDSGIELVHVSELMP